MSVFILLVIPAILCQGWADPVTSSVSQLSQKINEFSHGLYEQIRQTDSSLVFSPYSVHAALSMASLGARGETETEMMTTLGTASISNPHTTYRNLNVKLQSTQDVRLEVANGLFLNPSISLRPTFVQSVVDDYAARVDNFDLNAPEKKINDYVEENTNGIIKELLSQGTITSYTLAVLINTIFFNGTWDHQFSTRLTRKADFHKADGSISQVDMMGMNDPITVNLAHDDTRHLDMIDLPFEGLRFALRLVVPRDQSAMKQLETDPTNLRAVSSSSANFQMTRSVDVKIPKFKIETMQRMNDPLKALGIQKAFIRGQADFSEMSAVPAYISKVIHKAVIDVQESGTVAAAATALMVHALSMPIITERFVADRPFLFFLKDQETGTILFQGKFTG